MSTITRERIEQLANVNNICKVTREERIELARIALASLEAEPVAYMYKDNLHADARFSLHTRFGNWSQEDINEYEITEIPLYTAPPAPVSVPDEVNVLLNHLEDVLPDEAFNLIDVKTWNNVSMLSRPDVYRAAMLQGADGALTNEDTKRVGELVMWVKRLAHSLRKANPDSKLQSDAMDYLSRKGLIGVEDILR